MPKSVCVPDDYRGVWVRTGVHPTAVQAAAEASKAATAPLTWVRWLQTSLWHADLRVPDQALDARQAAPLASLTPEQLASLTHQSAFAGCTRVDPYPDGELCSWLKRNDYQPPEQLPEAAWMVFLTPDRVMRIVQHSDVTETWERLPDSVGRYRVLSGTDASGQDDGRLLLQAGVHLCLVRGRRRPWPRGLKAGNALVDVLLAQPEHALEWLDHEVSFGRCEGGVWRIERSTLPEREGLSLACEMRFLGASNEAEVLLGDTTCRWQVLEWTED
jgi:hypothetical protein